MDINNKDFRMYFPEKSIYIMRDHNWAFAAWEMERLKNRIEKRSTLLHVDFHTDYLEPIFEMPIIKTECEAKGIASLLDIAEFIRAAEKTGTIDNVFMISDDGIDDRECNYTRAYTFNQFENEFRMKFFERSINENNDNYILDIDLDFFNTNAHKFVDNNFDGNPCLYSDEFIIRQLEYLKDYTDWKVVTIAISPEFCGGIEAAKHLYSIALEVFKLDEKQGIQW